MPFKINISHKGKTLKFEIESEGLVGKKIGEKIKGENISRDLEGYELQITGTSDISGFPGKKGLEGPGYHKELLTRGFGMKNTQKGLRLRKTLRGEEISSKTNQINTKVVKEGNKKFDDLIKKPKKEEEKSTEEKKEKEKEKSEEAPKKEKPEEAKPEETPKEETKEKTE